MSSEEPSSDMCIKCAECCRNYPFIELSSDEIAVIVKSSGLLRDDFMNSKGVGGGYFLKFRANGDCIFLEFLDGNYACSVYEGRSSICKNYPSSKVQHAVCAENTGRL